MLKTVDGTPINQNIRFAAPNFAFAEDYEALKNLRPSYGYPTTTASDVSYTYGDSQWKDLLTTYNGQTITYDAIGNPLNYRDGITLTWQNGRELATFFNNSYDIEYTYDVNGMRTSKVINDSSEVNYVYENGLLLQMDFNGYIFDISYDVNGSPIGFRLDNGSYYYYGTNSRGDIIAIYNQSGTKLATYSYDAYGKFLGTTYILSNLTYNDNLAIDHNPLRYRGYVYDRETGFYYLQTRYYDPTTCRFINADNRISDVGNEILGYNTFTYCMNNPVNMSDPTGGWPQWLKNAVKWVATNIVKPAVQYAKTALESSGDRTYSIGINGSAAFGAGGAMSGGFITDTKGNIGRIVTFAGGVGTPSASGCVYSSVTNASEIYDLRGWSKQVGGSLDACGISIGGEYCSFEDPDTKKPYHGGTVLVGMGVSPPVEVHLENGYSIVDGINIFEKFEEAYIMLMEW